MPRPRAFDPTEALDCAMGVFWEKGYDATSMQDLVDAMGMHRGSIYNVFADKRTLFLHVLDHYMETYWFKRLRDDSREQPLQQVLTEIVEDILAGDREQGRPAGCLVTNTACELALRDPQIAQKVDGALEGMEQILVQRLQRAVQTGEIHVQTDLRTLAHYLLMLFQGLMVLARTGASRDDLQQAVRLAFASVF